MNRLQNAYQKMVDGFSGKPAESRRSILTPEEVNALKVTQGNLRSHAPQIQSQIDSMQQKMYQGILNRRAGNDN